MGVYVKWIILIVVLLFFITFGVKNSQPINLNYYFNIQNLELPIYGLAYISILIGILVGMLVGFLSRLSLQRRLRNLEKENQGLRGKVAEAERDEEKEALIA
jgi:uncharacterized integral membrane protein